MSMSDMLFLFQLCNVVGFICIKVTNTWISSIFYNLLYWIGNIVTLLLFLMYLFHFVEKFDKIPWLKLQFSYCAVMVLAYIVCSIIATTIAESVGYAVGVSSTPIFNNKTDNDKIFLKKKRILNTNSQH